MATICTLCYIHKDDHVLLQKKAKGLFGGDKYNAPGGKLQENESIEECAIREVKEETGLDVKNLKNHGVLHFYNGDESSVSIIVHVFSTKEFSGELKKVTREGVHQWTHKDQMPFEGMWEDDKWWVPFMFEGKEIEAHFYFEKDFGPVYKHKIEVKHKSL